MANSVTHIAHLGMDSNHSAKRCVFLGVRRDPKGTTNDHPNAPPLKEMKGVRNTTPDSFFLDILLIQERLEDALIFYDEPIVLGEEPPGAMHANAGTGVTTCGFTTKPRNKIQHNLSPMMRLMK